MKELIISVFGEYTPVTYSAIVSGAAVEVIPSGAAGVDWAFIAGVGFAALVVYCAFRLLGGLLNG